jgi:hypothetical protein
MGSGSLFRFAAELCVVAAGSVATARGDRLTVHEWGTFTVLQDDHGNAIRGVTPMTSRFRNSYTI